ncbi:MAG: cupin domain-containing protein [Actinobacteria bacterium]|nr:cupin domain-containing protein [Actinomycetota bacterium]
MKSRRRAAPPLHVHHKQEETVHVLKGRFKVRIGEETFVLGEGGFACLPSEIPHTFVNLTDEPAEIVVVCWGRRSAPTEPSPGLSPGPPFPPAPPSARGGRRRGDR